MHVVQSLRYQVACLGDPLPDLAAICQSSVDGADGLHTLTLWPANNDHSLAGTGVSIPFYYEGPYQPEPAGYTGTGAPGITLTSPAAGSTVSGDYFTRTACVSNFVLCGDCLCQRPAGAVRRTRSSGC